MNTNVTKLLVDEFAKNVRGLYAHGRNDDERDHLVLSIEGRNERGEKIMTTKAVSMAEIHHNWLVPPKPPSEQLSEALAFSLAGHRPSEPSDWTINGNGKEIIKMIAEEMQRDFHKFRDGL